MEFINSFYTWPGRATQRNFVFVAKGLKKVQLEQKLEEFEYIKVCKVDREQVMRELKNGRIKSAVTISTPLWLFYSIEGEDKIMYYQKLQALLRSY